MKKFLSFVLLVICFSLLTGCGSSGGGDGEADTSLILGTWELVKIAHPDNYSETVDVIPNNNDARTTITFHSNGMVSGLDFTLYFTSRFYGGSGFWETQDDGSQINGTWHLNGSTLTVGDSEGSGSYQVKFSGNTMTWLYDDGDSMVYRKVN